MKPSLELWSFEFPDVTGLDFFQQNPIDGGWTAPAIYTYHDVIGAILLSVMCVNGLSTLQLN
jgi:hypothetical protein